MKIKSDQDRSLIVFLSEQLERLPEIRSRRMFGGYGLYSGELFFAIIDAGQVYFKTDDTTKSRYEAMDLPAFKPGSHEITLKYHLVPVEVLEDADVLAEWANESLDVALKAFEAKKPKKKSVKTKGDNPFK